MFYFETDMNFYINNINSVILDADEKNNLL